jgi:hypothetical protein
LGVFGARRLQYFYDPDLAHGAAQAAGRKHGRIELAVARTAILSANGLSEMGQVAQGIGTITGVLLWGFGLWWVALATMITIRYWRAGVPFNLG